MQKKIPTFVNAYFIYKENLNICQLGQCLTVLMFYACKVANLKESHPVERQKGLNCNKAEIGSMFLLLCTVEEASK
jgi:hypothetical protein